MVEREKWQEHPLNHTKTRPNTERDSVALEAIMAHSVHIAVTYAT